MSTEIEVDGFKLAAHWSAGSLSRSSQALVLCHGFPAQRTLSIAFGETYPALADRLTQDTGWSVLAFDFRGTGHSEGDFTLAAWVRDLKAAVQYAKEQEGVTGVWIAGFGTGGSLGIVAAADDADICGTAAFGSPAHFEDWAENPEQCLTRARESGAIKSENFPENFNAWAKEFNEFRPESSISKVAPRPVLIVHGASDEVVSAEEARMLALSGGPAVDIRIIAGASHELRHDPRAIALLAGWMDQHRGS